MISLQLPTFPSHPHSFNNPYSHSYVMPDNSLPSVSGPMIPSLHKAVSVSNLPSSVDNKAKAGQTGAKRRPSRAGTRSVSTLTAAQLERKRANDREAQRAIRQRTKDHIDSLERRIAELTSGSDTNAKLVQALQRNEELEQENAMLRQRLSQAVSAMSDTGVGSDAISMIASPTSPNKRLRLNPSTLRTASLPLQTPRSLPGSAVHPGSQEPWNGVYTPVSATIERSPSVTDHTHTPSQQSMRWHPAHQAVSPPVTEPDRMMPPPMEQPMENVQQPVYYVDSRNQPMQMQYQQGPTMVNYPTQVASPAVSVQEYHRAHSGAEMTPSPAYAPYQQQQQYMPHSPHEPEGLPVIQGQPPHLMYLPPGMKAEQ